MQTKATLLECAFNFSTRMQGTHDCFEGACNCGAVGSRPRGSSPLPPEVRPFRSKLDITILNDVI